MIKLNKEKRDEFNSMKLEMINTAYPKDRMQTEKELQRNTYELK